jgi:hypothetical protein
MAENVVFVEHVLCGEKKNRITLAMSAENTVFRPRASTKAIQHAEPDPPDMA